MVILHNAIQTTAEYAVVAAMYGVKIGNSYDGTA